MSTTHGGVLQSPEAAGGRSIEAEINAQLRKRLAELESVEHRGAECYRLDSRVYRSAAAYALVALVIAIVTLIAY